MVKVVKRYGSLYRGSTNDLRARIDAHNSGKVKSIKSIRPLELIYYQAFTSKTDARREEKFLKSGRGRERIKFLLQETLGVDLKIKI
ncbi:MAG: GIY-YIG nuclease family protein [Patescibacteria group bacterium]